MPDSSRIPGAERLPIKLIMPKQCAEKKVSAGGTPPTPFRTVDPAYRKSLSTQVSAIRKALIPQIKQTGVAPVRVKLLTKAVADGAVAFCAAERHGYHF